MEIRLMGFADDRSVYLDGRILDPWRSQQAVNHSPDGFNWGYGGSGPAQLALAVLLELADEETARANYQRFKWEVIASLPQGEDFNRRIDVGAYLKSGEPLPTAAGA